MRIGDETVITMATIEAMADGVVQKTKECNSFLQFSEGLVRRDIDLVRMQFEIKLKKLHNRALAELQDLVSMERESLQERIGEASNILKRIKKTDKDQLDQYLLDESRMELEDLQEGINRKRIKFFVNEQFSELFNSMETFGECSVQNLKFAQETEVGETIEGDKQIMSKFQGDINKDKAKVSNINGVSGGDMNGFCSPRQSLENVDPLSALRSLSQANKRPNDVPIDNSKTMEKDDRENNGREVVKNKSLKTYKAMDGSTEHDVDKDSKQNTNTTKNPDTSCDSEREARGAAKTVDRISNRNQHYPKRSVNKESSEKVKKGNEVKTDNNLSKLSNNSTGKGETDVSSESPRQTRHERVAQANKIWFGSRIPMPVTEQKSNRRRSRSLSPKSARKSMSKNTVDIAIEKADNESDASGEKIGDADAFNKYVTSNGGDYRRKIGSTDERSESSEASRDGEVDVCSTLKDTTDNIGKIEESPREKMKKERQALKRSRNKTIAGDIASLLKEMNDNKVNAMNGNNKVNGHEIKTNGLDENGVENENDSDAKTRENSLTNIDVDSQRDDINKTVHGGMNVTSPERPLIGRDRKVRTLNLYGGSSVRRGLHSGGHILHDMSTSGQSRNGGVEKEGVINGSSKTQNIDSGTNQGGKIEVTGKDTKLSKLYESSEHRLRLPSLDDMLYTE